MPKPRRTTVVNRLDTTEVSSFPHNKVVSDIKYDIRMNNAEVSKIPTITCKTTAPLFCVFSNEIPFCNWPAVRVGNWLKPARRHAQLVEADK